MKLQYKPLDIYLNWEVLTMADGANWLVACGFWKDIGWNCVYVWFYRRWEVWTRAQTKKKGKKREECGHTVGHSWERCRPKKTPSDPSQHTTKHIFYYWEFWPAMWAHPTWQRPRWQSHRYTTNHHSQPTHLHLHHQRSEWIQKARPTDILKRCPLFPNRAIEHRTCIKIN